jgi:hypothetical protein
MSEEERLPTDVEIVVEGMLNDEGWQGNLDDEERMMALAAVDRGLSEALEQAAAKWRGRLRTLNAVGKMVTGEERREVLRAFLEL